VYTVIIAHGLFGDQQQTMLKELKFEEGSQKWVGELKMHGMIARKQKR